MPKHEVISKAEAEKLLKDLETTINNFPKILESDAVVKAIGAKKGDVVKITRNSVTAGKAISYRVVVSG